MQGPSHWKRKLAKKQPAELPKQRKKTASTLKGPVVSFEGYDAPSPDSRNSARPKPRRKVQPQGQGIQAPEVNPAKPTSGSSRAQRNKFRNVQGDDLIAAFKTKLESSTFRLLNEQIYSQPAAYGGQLLRNPTTFEDYHRGYRAQLQQWPVNPVSVILESLHHHPRGRFLQARGQSRGKAIPTQWVVADLGCGEAAISKDLTPLGYRVLSFDYCNKENELVTVADITQQLPGVAPGSVDVVVVCLALMATDYFGTIVEAHRLLKPKRLLKIVEVRSRIPHPSRFVELVCGVGFTCEWTDVIGDYFVAFDFVRDDARQGNTEPWHYPSEVLLPCLYKKR